MMQNQEGTTKRHNHKGMKCICPNGLAEDNSPKLAGKMMRELNHATQSSQQT